MRISMAMFSLVGIALCDATAVRAQNEIQSLQIFDPEAAKQLRDARETRGGVVVRGTPQRVDSAAAGKSLEDLTRSAILIIDATVRSIAPTVRTDSAIPWDRFVTDVALRVNRVVKGPRSEQIIVSQIVGQFGGLKIRSEEYDLMENGRRYILFLEPEPAVRTQALGAGAMPPRYSIIGEFIGLFRADADHVTMSRGISKQWRDLYERMTPAQLLDEIETQLKRGTSGPK